MPVLANACDPGTLAKLFAYNTVIFTAVIALFAAIEWMWNHFVKKDPSDESSFPGHEPFSACATVRFAFTSACWLIPSTLVLFFSFSWIAERFGLTLPKQDLILLITNPKTPLIAKGLIAAFAIFEAPLLEELIFRRYLFRALLRRLKLPFSMLISGALFSLVHFNAAVFLPIAFLGCGFAWIYWRTGRIAASMLCHLLFNLTNVILALTFPELA